MAFRFSASPSVSSSPSTLHPKLNEEFEINNNKTIPPSFFLLLASLKSVEHTWKLKGLKITRGQNSDNSHISHIDKSCVAVNNFKNSQAQLRPSVQIQVQVEVNFDIDILISRARDQVRVEDKFKMHGNDNGNGFHSGSNSSAMQFHLLQNRKFSTTSTLTDVDDYAGIEYYNSILPSNTNGNTNTNARTKGRRKLRRNRLPRNREPSNSGMRNTTPILSQVFSLFSTCRLMPYTYSKKELLLENCDRAQLIQFNISLALNFIYTFYTFFRIFSILAKIAQSKEFNSEQTGELNVMISQFCLTAMVLTWQFNVYKYRHQVRVFVNQLSWFRTQMLDDKTTGLQKDFVFIKFFLLIFTARILGTLISAVKNPNKYQFMYSILPQSVKTGRWNWFYFTVHLLFTAEYLLGSYLLAFTVALFPFVLYYETVRVFLKARLMDYEKIEKEDGAEEDIEVTLQSYQSLLILSTQFNFCYGTIILPGATSILIFMGIAAGFSFIKFFSRLHSSQLVLVALPLLVLVRMVPWLFPAAAQISTMSQEWVRQIYKRLILLNIKIDKNKDNDHDNDNESDHDNNNKMYTQQESDGNKRRFSLIPVHFNYSVSKGLMTEKRIVKLYLKSLRPITINIGSFFPIKRVTCLTVSSFIVVQTISLLFIFK